MPFIAGPYQATWNSVSVGQLEDGFEIEHSLSQEDIVGQDMGDSVQDGVYRGGNMFINMTLMEYSQSSAMLALWWVHSQVLGRMGQVGTLMQQTYSQPLVLTAVAGTPALGNPTTITCAHAALAANFDVRLLLAPRLRRVPLRLRLYPYSDGAGHNLWFSTT